MVVRANWKGYELRADRLLAASDETGIRSKRLGRREEERAPELWSRSPQCHSPDYFFAKDRHVCTFGWLDVGRRRREAAVEMDAEMVVRAGLRGKAARGMD